MLHIKVHKVEGRIILTIVDPELIGKVFEEGDTILDLSSKFYAGKDTLIGDVDQYLKIADIINAVGEKAVNYLLDHDMVKKKDILKVRNIPHVQVVRLD